MIPLTLTLSHKAERRTECSLKDRTVVTGVIGADSHSIGNWILQYALREAGFEVVALGILVSQEDFIHAAIETDAAAILVSSIYGHGILDCEGFREKCEEAGLKGMLLYAGGNLVVGKHDWGEVERKFKEMGFDRVYPPNTLPATAIADLKNDIIARRSNCSTRP
ncbi:MAG: methylaspartate mutase subunit S [Chloroflexi bacterium]|nr:methylaspartate mutase subunit S [Chloroflexota bacterium]